MKSIGSLLLIATFFVSMSAIAVDTAEAKAKPSVNKIKSYNPDQRKKLFEWAMKECNKQYGGAGYHSPEINYATGRIMCRG